MRMYHYTRVQPIHTIPQPESRSGKHTPKRTAETAVKEKLKVLREFCIVDDRNETVIRERLEKAIADKPDLNFDVVLDRMAKRMINEKLGE